MMQRRQFLQSGSLGAGSFFLPRSLASLLAPYEMKPLRRNVGFFMERGGTIGWLSHKRGRVVIDAQFPDSAAHFIDELKRLGTAPIEMLVNTHHHGDHTSGNIVFKGLVSKVLAHENALKNLKDVSARNGKEAEQYYPTATYSDRWQQRVANEILDIQYWGPGHTNGDSIVHFQHANVVHCGDLVFNRRHPVIDTNAGARIENWIKILKRMQDDFDRDTIFIFGHARQGMPVTGGKADLAAFENYLRALLGFVDSQWKAGASREQILAATEIPGAPEWQGDGIQRSLRAALIEITGSAE